MKFVILALFLVGCRTLNSEIQTINGKNYIRVVCSNTRDCLKEAVRVCGTSGYTIDGHNEERLQVVLFHCNNDK